MALVESNRKINYYGNDRIIRTRLTFTSITGATWDSGFGELANIQLTNLTAPERGYDVDHTTTKGSLIFTNLTSGDVVDVLVTIVK